VEKIRKLNHREKHVLELRYGLFSGFRKTKRKIARKMGVNKKAAIFAAFFVSVFGGIHQLDAN